MKQLPIITFSIFLLLTKSYGLAVKDLVVFGDSLSCGGNACMHASNPDQLCVDYPKGFFTDGQIWVEILAEKMGVARPLPSLIDGLNYAYGGATTGRKQSPHILNVGNQIEEFFKHTQGRANPNNLYILWAGCNDIKNNPFAKTKKLISNLEEHITALAKAGAKTFLIPNIPPLEKTPVAQSLFSLLGEALGDTDDDSIDLNLAFFIDNLAEKRIRYINSKLESMLVKLERSLRIKIYRFDAYHHFHQLMANLEDYGLYSLDQLFIFDSFHPSAITHKLIAEKAYKIISR